ncbi:MAG: DMT family transporter [Ilumatobacteraceae bacterium]|nr:MAG: DMT family transporter [Actinomycetota bacterium]
MSAAPAVARGTPRSGELVADSRLPLVASAIAVFFWGLGPLIVVGITASTQTIVLYRMLLGIPVMFVASLLFGDRITRATFRHALVPGILFGTSMILGFAAIRTTSIANATLIGALVPAVVLLGAGRLVGEPPRLDKVPFAALAIGGLALMVLSGSATSGATLRGDLLAVVNLLLFTAYFLSVKKLRNAGVESWSFLVAVFVVGSAVVAPWALATADDLGGFGAKDWLLLGSMVLGPGVVGHGLMTWTQRHLSLTTSSLMTLASPVVSTLGAWLVYDQRLAGLQLLGAAGVLAGLVGVVVDSRQRVTVAPAASGGEPLVG